MSWRDEATLAVMALLHAAAAEAMGTLEEQLSTIAIIDAMTNANAPARVIVRPAMRAAVGPAADNWFTVQARALRQIDARMETLALGFAALGDRPALPADEAAKPVMGWSAPGWLRDAAGSLDSAIKSADQVTARARHEMGKRSGAHDRLRDGGRNELARIWLGPVPPDGSPRPYLTQLLDTVDCTTRQAMEIIE